MTIVTLNLPSSNRSTKILRWLSHLFTLAGIAALGCAGYVYSSAYFFQRTQNLSFNQEVALAPGAPAIEHVISEGGVLGRIEIGRLGLSAIVVEGDSPTLLRRAVGHVPQTAMPGANGNVVLTAHRDTFFRSLRNIQQGDVITLDTTGGDYQYAVASMAIVPPTATEVLQSSATEELTLITCYPFYYVGPAPSRFVVRAHRIEHTGD